MIQRISKISKWLISVTKSVLKPLLLSALCRHLYFFAHLVILGFGTWIVTTLFATMQSNTTSPISLWWGIAFLVLLTISKAIANYFEHFLGHLVAFKALEILRTEFYRAILPLATENSHKSGDLLLRATKDIDRIEVFYAHTFAPAVTAVTIPLITLSVLYPFVGIIPFTIAMSGILFSIFFVPTIGAKRAFESATTASIARANLTQHVTDSIQGLAEITGYGRTKNRLKQLAQLDHKLGKKLQPRRHYATIRNCAFVFLALSTTLSVAVTGFYLQIAPINLSIFTVITWSLFSVTAGVRDFAADLDNSLAAAERIYEIVHTPASRTFTTHSLTLPAGALAVNFINVTHYYQSNANSLDRNENSQHPALQNISFTVPAGTHTCLIGHSGCGKSTILKLIARHFDPTAGTIHLAGKDLKKISEKDLSRVLLVEQNAILFNASVAENLRLANPHASAKDLLYTLEIVELAAEIAPRGGLDLNIGEGGKLLSGGQRQRLALARAILLKPDVLLLDEYTAHLNSDLANRIRKNLRQALPKLTIIESTHSPASLSQADQIIVLDNGKIQACGALAQVRDCASLARLMAQNRFTAQQNTSTEK